MSAVETQIQQLEMTIAALEAQQAASGDEILVPVLQSLRQQVQQLRLAHTAGQSAPMEGERKLVTVMFADISGFTALSEKLDPEEVRNLMNACFDRLVPAILKYEGKIDKFIGDAVMALFGAPLSHENHAERALRAALEMREVLQSFNVAHHTTLDIHIGINSGLVVAGGIGARGQQQYSVMGDAVNLAARLEDASERGEILVGASTYRLTAPLFSFDTCDPIKVKGKEDPVAIYRLVESRTTPGSLRGIDGLRSRLVGRASELTRLTGALDELIDGRGAVIAVTGEAGVGKSRLLAEARVLLHENAIWVSGRAFSYTGGISYWMVRDILYGLIGVTPDTALEEINLALQNSVERLFPTHARDIYYHLAQLLELPLEQPGVRPLPAELQRERTLKACVDYFQACAAEKPLVLEWEDLHWCDPSSLTLLERLIPVTQAVPLLLLFTFRSEPGLTWEFHERMLATYHPFYHLIELTSLTRDESSELLNNLLHIENLPAATCSMILDKAGGNAFFLEEVLRSLIDAGVVVVRGGRAFATQKINLLKALDVPDTLQDMIAARIDRLSASDKRTLQTASIIGRVFQHRVLAYLFEHQLTDITLDNSLDLLKQQEFIRIQNDLEYIFKHAVTQDVAYNGILIARRQELHRVTAEAMESLFPANLDELSPALSYHYERAGLPEKAVHYLKKAAQHAAAIFANVEAILFYQSAIRQVSLLLESDQAAAKWHHIATELYEELGATFALTGRYEDARAAYQKALEILPDAESVAKSRLYRATLVGLPPDARLKVYEQADAALGSPQEDNPSWWHEWIGIQLDRINIYLMVGNSEEMSRLVEQVKPVIETHGALSQQADFLQALVMTNLVRDGFTVSDETLAYASRAAQARQDMRDLLGTAQAWFRLGYCHCWRNELDEAEKQMQAALRMAELTGYVSTKAGCLTYLALVARRRGDIPAARSYADQGLVVATEAGEVIYIGLAKATLAWAAWREGDHIRVRQNSLAALDVWNQVAIIFPFQWTARLPMLALALTASNLVQGFEQARAILGVGQQRLPDMLINPLMKGIQDWDCGKHDMAHEHFQQAVLQAQALGYL